MKKYVLIEEHEKQIPEHNQKWIDNAFSTKQMTEEEKEICRENVEKLYRAANLTPPSKVVFVASPFILRFASGFASELLKLERDDLQKRMQKLKKLKLQTMFEYNIYKAIFECLPFETDILSTMKLENSNLITEDLKNWYNVDTKCLKQMDKKLGLKGDGLKAINQMYDSWQGGNQWASGAAFISFYKDIVKLPIDFTNYLPWEQLALHSGPRITMETFCMIADRPTKLLLDNQNRPHNTFGAFCEWSDGTKLYSVNGTRVPAWIIESHNNRIERKITVKDIDTERNIEVRRVMLNLFGENKYLLEGDYKVLHTDTDQFGHPRRLLQSQNGDDEPITKLEVINSTAEKLAAQLIDIHLEGLYLENGKYYKKYYLPVDFELRPLKKDPDEQSAEMSRDELIENGYLGEPQEFTCHNAVASTFGKRGEEYGLPGQTRQGDVFVEMKTGASLTFKFRES